VTLTTEKRVCTSLLMVLVEVGEEKVKVCIFGEKACMEDDRVESWFG